MNDLRFVAVVPKNNHPFPSIVTVNYPSAICKTKASLTAHSATSINSSKISFRNSCCKTSVKRERAMRRNSFRKSCTRAQVSINVKTRISFMRLCRNCCCIGTLFNLHTNKGKYVRGPVCKTCVLIFYKICCSRYTTCFQIFYSRLFSTLVLISSISLSILSNCTMICTGVLFRKYCTIKLPVTVIADPKRVQRRFSTNRTLNNSVPVVLKFFSFLQLFNCHLCTPFLFRCWKLVYIFKCFLPSKLS